MFGYTSIGSSPIGYSSTENTPVVPEVMMTVILSNAGDGFSLSVEAAVLSIAGVSMSLLNSVDTFTLIMQAIPRVGYDVSHRRLCKVDKEIRIITI